MTQEQVTNLITRIDKLTPDSKAKFGMMNVGQMICHCTDQLRHTLGLRIIDRQVNVNTTEIMNLAKAGKLVPTPKGLGQVEGDGTKPTDFITDRETLKKHIIEFSQLTDSFKFLPHPYFGDFDRLKWTNFVLYHLNHHLQQFGV